MSPMYSSHPLILNNFSASATCVIHLIMFMVSYERKEHELSNDVQCTMVNSHPQI